MPGNSQRRTQAGGADSAHRDKAGLLIRPDNVILVLGGRAQAGIHGRDLVVLQRRQYLLCALAKTGERLGNQDCLVTRLLVFGSRTGKEVAKLNSDISYGAFLLSLTSYR